MCDNQKLQCVKDNTAQSYGQIGHTVILISRQYVDINVRLPSSVWPVLDVEVKQLKLFSFGEK